MPLPSVVELLLVNAATATLLALAAAIGGRLTRRPGLAHALWALVLVKLLFPPVIEMAVVPRVPVVPTVTAHASIAVSPATPVHTPAAPLTVPGLVEVAPGPAPAVASWPTALLAAWAAGSVFLGGLTLARVRRFHRLVSAGGPAPPELARATRRLARHMGVRVPVLKVVVGRISPMLWFPGRRPTLLFPAALLGVLDAGERDALLAHELAHVRRRDHWLRFVELAATIAFWWHPVVWRARLMLRRLEEQSCDAEVLHALPGQAAPYARGLVKTVEFLAGAPTVVPALASGAARKGPARHMEERLTMILNDTTPRVLSPTQRLVLTLAACGALLIVPSWADPRDAADTPAADEPALDEEYRQRLRDLDFEALELQRRMQDLNTQRREIELRRAQLERERSAAVLHERAAQAAREGRPEDAQRMRRKAADAEARAGREREMGSIGMDQIRRAEELELELRRRRIEADRAAAVGDDRRARELAQSLTELKLQWELTQRELDQIEAEGGFRQDSAAAELDRALAFESQRRAVEERKARREAILAKLEAAEAEARRLEANGEHDRAEELLRKIEAMREGLAAELERRRVY